MKTPERRHWRHSGDFIVDFEHISQLFLVLLLLTSMKWMLAGMFSTDRVFHIVPLMSTVNPQFHYDFVLHNVHGKAIVTLRFFIEPVYAIIIIKVGLSSSKKIFLVCFNDSPSKMIKNAFDFILKRLFVLKIFNFCLDILIM